jgi:hypothetical protein
VASKPLRCTLLEYLYDKTCSDPLTKRAAHDEQETQNVLSAAFQKQRSRTKQLTQECYKLHQTPHLVRIPTTLHKPPDWYNHCLRIATEKAKSSRSTFCTVLHLAVGHSFKAGYTCRFKKDLDLLDTTYKCSSPYHFRLLPIPCAPGTTTIGARALLRPFQLH